MITPAFPRAPGTYVLLLTLPQAVCLTVGKLGRFDFPPGTYAYAGSARGSGGLAGRLGHHLRPTARPHWHIDVLRANATVAAVWWCADAIVREHAWAAALAALPGAQLVAPRFGASDCHCPAHLLHYAAPPASAAFVELAGGEVHVVALA